jgi:hypothetical protein
VDKTLEIVFSRDGVLISRSTTDRLT